ncbi:MAG: DNA translocase FtsK, partial [Pseudomonadota bacterium]
PIFVAFAAVYASTLQPGAEWTQTHAFGLGGRGGDTVLAMVLAVLPLGSAFAVKLMSLLMAIGVLVFGAFVLGFTRAEVIRLARFLLVGLVVTYATVMAVITRTVSGTVTVARGLQERQAARRAERAAAAAEAEAYAHSIPVMPEVLDEPIERPSLLSRMPTLIKRAEAMPDTMPVPELVEAPYAPEAEAPSDARISAKITDVIKARVRS